MSKSFRCGPEECRRCRDALDLTVKACSDRDRRAEVPALAQEPERVGERQGQRSARELHVRHAGVRSDACAHRCDLAVEGAAHDGDPGQRRRQRPPFLTVVDRGLARRVRQLHDVRAGIRRKVETAREVHVQHVEAAGPELELARLCVDDHLVAELDGAGEPGIRDAGPAVHLDPRKPFDAFDDRGHPAASKRQHLERRRRGRASPRPCPRGPRR